MKTVFLNGKSLTLQDVVNVARKGCKVEIAPEAKEQIKECSQAVKEWVDEGRVVYGVTTGFGDLASVVIPRDVYKRQVIPQRGGAFDKFRRRLRPGRDEICFGKQEDDPLLFSGRKPSPDLCRKVISVLHHGVEMRLCSGGAAEERGHPPVAVTGDQRYPVGYGFRLRQLPDVYKRQV